MKVACVGAHGSYLDRGIYAETMTLLKVPICIKPSIDMIDLRNGRDFLKESLTYDVVILHYIFVLSPAEYRMIYRSVSGLDRRDFKTSELHTPDNWRQRLLQTGAREVLIFGFSSHGEITGDYIGELQGYELEHIKTHRGSIWRYTKRQQ